MTVLLVITGFIILVSSLFFIYSKTQLYIGLCPPENDNREAVQSIISGIFILALSLVLSIFKLTFILLALVGLYIILSGTRVIRKLSKKQPVLELVKDIRTGLLFNVLGLFLIVIVLAAGREPAEPGKPVVKETKAAKEVKPAKEVKTEEVVKKEKPASDTKTVRRMGYVRSGPSKRDRIVGVSIKGEKVKVLESENGYYRVKGEYLKGKTGREGKEDGKFWIGGGLLE
jgi:hypothetical protein